tara:strand:+ start:34 stop:495 length:462 start_codon:yes stop_codon:yes gene_type:complete
MSITSFIAFFWAPLNLPNLALVIGLLKSNLGFLPNLVVCFFARLIKALASAFLIALETLSVTLFNAADSEINGIFGITGVLVGVLLSFTSTLPLLPMNPLALPLLTFAPGIRVPIAVLNAIPDSYTFFAPISGGFAFLSFLISLITPVSYTHL